MGREKDTDGSASRSKRVRKRFKPKIAKAKEPDSTDDVTTSAPNNEKVRMTTFGGGRTPITRETYNKLLEWFRDHVKPKWAPAAEFAGVNHQTAKRAYMTGWPNRAVPMHPIRRVLEEESKEARAMRAQTVRELAKADAIKTVDAHNDAVRTREQEGLMVGATRTVAGKILKQTVKLVEVCSKLTGDVVEQIDREYAGSDAFGDPKKDLIDRLDVLERVQTYAKHGTALAETAMVLERKFMGEPEKVIGHQMSDTEAVAELMAGMRALERVTSDVNQLEDGGSPDAIAALMPAILETMSDEERDNVLAGGEPEAGDEDRAADEDWEDAGEEE